ncbi:hypothetical protein ACH49_24215 [Streptomyces leeuwenhoekii]|uniref:Uncharacterized protein n=1 Tax=Streptomyces leeuwenhoekii TaxID=1437453 RepID=A0ABR5HTB4_STRLW|nr:hypothetical protein ACH49_24215 [Streptomyces leeuwenhoekii]
MLEGTLLPHHDVLATFVRVLGGDVPHLNRARRALRLVGRGGLPGGPRFPVVFALRGVEVG